MQVLIFSLEENSTGKSWRVRIIMFAVEKRQCHVCVLLRYMSVTVTLWKHGVLRKNAFIVDLSGPQITTYLGLHVKGPIIITDFNQMWGSSTDIYESSQNQTSQISLNWESPWSMRTDRRTDRMMDMTKLMNAFRLKRTRRCTFFWSHRRNGMRNKFPHLLLLFMFL